MKGIEKGCPYGKDLTEENETLAARLTAIETKLAAVLGATATDSGKKVAVDSDGKIILASS